MLFFLDFYYAFVLFLTDKFIPPIAIECHAGKYPNR